MLSSIQSSEVQTTTRQNIDGTEQECMKDLLKVGPVLSELRSKWQSATVQRCYIGFMFVYSYIHIP